MSIEDELLAIKGDRELLLVDEAIAWAKDNPQSLLHGRLNWNDREAAQEHRRWQMRQLISVYITYEDGGRRFISLSIDRGKNGGGYRDLDEVREVPPLREMMLNDALAELQRMQLKYDYLQELARIWSEADVVRRKRGRPPKQAKRKTERSEARP
jgi:hypothetical protein